MAVAAGMIFLRKALFNTDLGKVLIYASNFCRINNRWMLRGWLLAPPKLNSIRKKESLRLVNFAHEFQKTSAKPEYPLFDRTGRWDLRLDHLLNPVLCWQLLSLHCLYIYHPISHDRLSVPRTPIESCSSVSFALLFLANLFIHHEPTIASSCLNTVV